MSAQTSINDLNKLIEQRSEKVTDIIAKLDSLCIYDERGQTPLNTAIQFFNNEAVKQIVENQDTINFFAPIDKGLLTPVKYTVGSTLNESNIKDTEKSLQRTFGEQCFLQRAPLHQACRYANFEVIETLIDKQAVLNQRDILGLTPVELCLNYCDADFTARFINLCLDSEQVLKVDDLTLRLACGTESVYQQLIEYGDLTIRAKRFAFSLACALLDQQSANKVLAQGLDIKQSTSVEFNPLVEASTSNLAHQYKLPEAPRLLSNLVTLNTFDTAIQIDNDLILNAESIEEIMAEFENALSGTNEPCPSDTKPLSQAQRDQQISRRLAFIDFLLEQGLKAEMAVKKAPYGLLDDIVNSNSPELLNCLVNLGFSFPPENGYEHTDILMALSNENFAMVTPLLQLGHKWRNIEETHPTEMQKYHKWKNGVNDDVAELTSQHSQPVIDSQAPSFKAVTNSDAFWELAGESALFAATIPEKLLDGQPALIRITHHNLYGPFDTTQLFVRIGDPSNPTKFNDLGAHSDWLPMDLVEELVDFDGARVLRGTVKEPLYEEMSWEGTFEAKLSFDKGSSSIEIKIVSDIEEMNGVISDWIITVE